MTTFHLETYGRHNLADAEQMAGLLKEAQFELAESVEKADIIIFNTCAIDAPAEDVFFTRLETVKKEYPYKIIIIAGCLPQADPHKLKTYSLLGTWQIHHIVEVVEEALHNNIIHMLETGEMPPLNLPKIRQNPWVEIIPLSRGCLNVSPLSKTKPVREHLPSYPVSAIVEVAQKAVNEGVRQIWLTSQNTGSYGLDLGTDLASLVRELLQIPGQFKIRLDPGQPGHIHKFYPELFPLLNHEKMFKFVHLPLQSGSNYILKTMRRGITAEEFLRMVQELRLAVPEVTLATDIMVGFPGETDEVHWQTINLLRKITPDVLNISRYCPKQKIPAAKKPSLAIELPLEIIQHRTKVLMDIFQSISRMQNERWLGWEGEIIIDEKGIQPRQWLGRNSSYKPVLVAGKFKLGEVVNVKITKVTALELWGEVLKNV